MKTKYSKKDDSILNVMTLFLFLIILSSCQSQVYNEDVVDLKSFDLQINVSNFYAKSLNRDNIKYSSEKQYVSKDTLNGYDLDWTGDKKQIFGVRYRVVSYSESDTVARYNNVNFFLIESMVNKENDLMIINAETSSNSKKINELVAELNSEFDKKPKVNQNDSGFFYYRILTWENKNKIIKLVTDVKLDFSNIDIDKASKEAIAKIEKDGLSNSTLFICNPKYKDKLLGKVGTGNWSRFK